MGAWWRSFQSLLPLAACLGVIWLGVGISWDRLSQSRKKHALTLLSVSWLSALVLLTLAPQGPSLDAEGRSTYHLLNLRPFSDIADTTAHAVSWRVGVEQVGGNIALFIPLGILGYLLVEQRTLSTGFALLLGPVVGGGVELVQWVVPLGRATTVDDVILATVGATTGFAISLLVRHRTRRSAIRRDGEGPRTQGSAQAPR